MTDDHTAGEWVSVAATIVVWLAIIVRAVLRRKARS